MFLENRNQYGVVIEPKFDENGWTGEVEVKLAFSDHNDLDAEGKETMAQVISMMAASLELMETDLTVADRLVEILERNFTSDDNSEKELLTNELEVDGNIIKFDFASKTKGNA